MSDIKRLPLDKILIGDRRREIDRGIAAAIGASMREHGQLQPVLVRATPAAERPYTLVIGGHRTVGAEIEGMTEIDAIVVKASSTQAQLMEIAENVDRNDLSVIDRATFVQAYRELMQEKHGRIGRGGDPSAKLAVWATEGATSFADYVADRLGYSKRAVERFGQIAMHLQPDLKRALQGTALADNQDRILKLIRLEPKKQRQLAFAFAQDGDIDRALALVEPPPKPSRHRIEQATLLSRLVSAWEDASTETREQFLSHIGVADDAAPTSLMTEIREEAA